MPPITVQPNERYQEIVPERSPYEWRAQKCAALTVPFLFAREGTTGSDQFLTPFGNEATRGVNNMASAVTLALLPPTIPHFRLEMMPRLEAEIRALQSEYQNQGRPERPFDEVQAGLARWERQAVKEIERHNYRVGCYESVRSLLVVGNCLAEHLDEGGLRIHGLRSYAVRRYPDDRVAEIILVEHKNKTQLTDEERNAVTSRDWAWPSLGPNDSIPLYTYLRFGRDEYEMVQQIGDAIVPDSEDGGSAEDCPFWPLRWSRVSGEHYGRSFVEEYYGDISSHDISQQSLIEAGALAAKVLFMVDPGSGVSPKSLETAPNGAFRSGRAEAITTLQMNKAADLAVTFQVWERMSAHISRAFAAPEVRNAERVTAEEIRFLQQQLERNLGGVFPLLALDFQLPLARQLLKRLKNQRALPALPQGMVEPVIVTGIQALGRSMDAEKLIRLASASNAALGPEATARRLDEGAWLSRLADAEGLDAQGLVRSDEQIAAMQQQAARQQMEAEVAKGIVGSAGKVIAKAVPEGSLGPAAAA
jgi:hypothetical protein